MSVPATSSLAMLSDPMSVKSVGNSSIPGAFHSASSGGIVTATSGMLTLDGPSAPVTSAHGYASSVHGSLSVAVTWAELEGRNIPATTVSTASANLPTTVTG